MKSKKVLSIEQMRRLQKLGVDTSTASWFYDLKYGGDSDVVKYPKRLSQYIQDGNGIGAFTLQDILEIMPVLYPTMKNGKRILVDSSREDSGCHYQPTIFHSEDGSFQSCSNSCSFYPFYVYAESMDELLDKVIEEDKRMFEKEANKARKEMGIALQ